MSQVEKKEASSMPAKFENYVSPHDLLTKADLSDAERFDELNSDLPNETVFYKDHVVMWGKELSRTIDYLESRTDIQVDKLGYLGFSWGGHLGGILPATEKRIKAVVLNVGGMMMNTTLPEADQLKRIKRDLGR